MPLYYASDNDPVVELDDGTVYIYNHPDWEEAGDGILDAPSTMLVGSPEGYPFGKVTGPEAKAQLEKWQAGG